MNHSSATRALERASGRPGTALGSLLFAFGLAVSLSPNWSDAQSQMPIMSVAFQNGTITAVHQTTFEIDGRAFGLTPDAVILDDKGNEIGPGSLVVTAEVKYHVKKEHNDKIDRMIVFFPR